MAPRPTIPGDPSLAEELAAAAKQDALGHALVFTGEGDLLSAALFAAAALQCEGNSRPCGECSACRKILRGVHPDVVTVEDAEHKNLSIDVVRTACAGAYLSPNEGRRKVYIFPDGSRLTPQVQNVLLKILEEGPPRAAFLFCCANSSVLLPTVRSRATVWRLTGAAAAPEVSADARELCRLLEKGREAELAAFCLSLEERKMDRAALQALLSQARDLLTRALAACYGIEAGPDERALAALGRQRLNRAADTLGQFAVQCKYNIGVGHLSGALMAGLQGG